MRELINSTDSIMYMFINYIVDKANQQQRYYCTEAQIIYLCILSNTKHSVKWFKLSLVWHSHNGPIWSKM